MKKKEHISGRSSLLLFLAVGALLISQSPSEAANGWRYWGYFQAAPFVTTWSYALTGPTTNLRDGSVEGWAFTFSGDDVPDAAPPKIAPQFSKLCASTKAVAGKKRIGVVIDFGSAVLRPRGETLPRALTACVLLNKDGTGVDALNAAVKVRYAASGYVCGINNYPAKECGVEIPTPRSMTKVQPK